MKKIVKILIICSGILISIIPAIYLVIELMLYIGIPIKTHADGTKEFILIDAFTPTGQPIPIWLMLLWGLFGILIIIVGIKKVKS